MVAARAAPKVGLWAWTFVGVVATLIIIATMVAALNEILRPWAAPCTSTPSSCWW